MMMMATLPALLSFGERATQIPVSAAVKATATKAPMNAQTIVEISCLIGVQRPRPKLSDPAHGTQ